MKNLSFFDKIMFILNSIVGAVLLISYLLPFINPIHFAALSAFSLFVPVLISVNLIFLVYWLIRIKKQAILPIFLFLVGLPIFPSYFKINKKELVKKETSIEVMSYNVRMFNLYKWLPEEGIDKKIVDFINEENPDIICFQEYHPNEKLKLDYPYKYVKIHNKKNNFGQAIFSKHRIMNKGVLNFDKTNNDAIFADIKVDTTILRVYNIHLESLKINPSKQNFGEKDGKMLHKRVASAFEKQGNQAIKVLKHEQNSPYKTILCGDFNNTPFSWVYYKLKGTKKDAFIEAGEGFGKTFNYPFPVRIDFILVDDSYEVDDFEVFPLNYSDHFPISAKVELK
ncbi:endonuclease/exonuclease/phosphatase family protein [Aureivirga sp. CE67]|uniref:endonuclease/exonuclease/phosphatase family protein n=1 Tax=Aureivirga sp. CE67 TaxID=1788983 RepID=UPI0018C94B7B|nr:endonuclease/exonuclease/phosphatase family protein [Aureivirga sp. CE67]